MKLREKRKLALVLSGGGIKAAAFHIGVCLALQEKGFRFAGGTPEEVQEKFSDDSLTFKTYVGSSAGAVISSFLASGYTIEAVIDAFERGTESTLSKLKRNHTSTMGGKRLKTITYRDLFTLNGINFFHLIPGLLRRQMLVSGGIEAFLKSGFKLNGLFTTRGIESYVRNNVNPSNTFASLGVALYVVATQLNHSRKVVFGNFPESTKDRTVKYASYATISDAVAASASLPPVFAPYGIRNQKGKEIFYFDGEIRDTLSTHVAADHGADLVVASYSIQPYHYNDEMGSLHSYGIPMIINQALYQVLEQKIAKHIEAQHNISQIMNAVSGYFKQAGLPEEHRVKLLDILAQRVGYRSDVDYIYIHPNPHDYEMFFVDHFSLNPNILAHIVQIGFKAALGQLRKLDL